MRRLATGRRFIHFLHSIPESRRWVGLLMAVNGLGAIYGFNWYAEQLARTPAYLWPVVPDSPLSTLLFALFLLALLRGKERPWLGAYAQLATFKYGLWTVLVLGGFMASRGVWDAEMALLTATHGGMALEAYLFMGARPQPSRARLGAAVLLLINDVLDYYVAGTHPAVPDPSAIGSVAAQALALTAAAILLSHVLARRETGA